MTQLITTKINRIRRTNQVFTPLLASSTLVEHETIRPASARQEEMKFQIYLL
jgi:hypothetical protein